MNPLENDFKFKDYGSREFTVGNSKMMHSNLFIKRSDADWYSKCNRYGWIDPFDTDRVTREYLFFTKPDLNIFSKSTASSSEIVSKLSNNPVIKEAVSRMPNAVAQLQSSVKNPDGKKGAFMFLLSNAVASKLDLPGISAESHESTTNIMGTSIQYRGHSLKSDNGYDFSLSFKDTAYLEIYTLAKVYDEYMRMIKQGLASPKETYIINHILSEQFSIYKFLVGSDGETILYYAKATGCYITDVPRSDMSDPSDEGFKYSLSFHAQFIEDMNPYILKEFSLVSNNGDVKNALPVFDTNNIVNNEWARYPKIVKVTKSKSKRVKRRGVKYDYLLKWTNS